MHRYLRRSFAAQAFITCSRKGDWRQAHSADQNGLVQGHAYTITGLYRVPPISAEEAEKNKAIGDPRTHLLRVRNPWGDRNEWKGEWSDGDDKWAKVTESTRKEGSVVVVLQY